MTKIGMTKNEAIAECRKNIDRLKIARVTTKSEAAALIESLESERDALAEQLRVMREALNASATAQAADEEENVSFDCQMACRIEAETKRINALAFTPTAAEAQAKANAEKAGLLEWLDHTRPSLSFGCSPEYPLGAWGIYWTNAQTKQVEEAEAERLPDALRSAREASDAGE